MTHFYYIPEWFFQFSILLEILFAIASGIVAYYAYKVYKVSSQRESGLFTLSFVFISLSYLFKSIINLFVLDELKDQIRTLTVETLGNLSRIGFYSYILLFVLGLTTLAYMTLKKKNIMFYLLLVAINFVVILHAADAVFLFEILTSFILLYLCGHYAYEYKLNGNYKTLLVLIAFIFFLFSGLGFVVAQDYYLNFVVGHLFELAAYILITVSLVLTIKGTGRHSSVK
jgi:hypothetical protein